MSEAKKQQLVILGIIATTLPFFFIIDVPSNLALTGDAMRSFALYLSSVAGYIGLALLVWEFALGTRSVSGLYFADLASKLKLHRWLGTYGMAAFVLHVVFVVIGYNKPLLYGLVPSFSDSYETAVTYGRFAFIGLLVIWLTSAIIRRAMAYRPWKYVHYIAYPILFLSLLHIPTIGRSFADRAVLLYWIVFVTAVLLCTALRMRHLFGYGKVTYVIEKNDSIGEDVFLLQLRARTKIIDVLPGQYIYLQLGLLHEEHPFTILDFDNAGRVVIVYKIYGDFTTKLAQLSQGESLLVDGPYGNFLREKSEDLQPESVFIAGGIGVTPFLWHAMHRQQDNYYLFYANKSREGAVLRDRLKSALGDRYVDIFSRQSVAPSAPNAETGHISAGIIQKYIHEPLKREYYICGPSGLIETTKEQLRVIGVAPNQIHAEEFNF